MWKLENNYSLHHSLPKSRDWSNAERNIQLIKNTTHRAIHTLFANQMIGEQLITTVWLSERALREDVRRRLIDIIKRYWRPLSTISWWLYKILDTQNKNGILRTKQKTMRMPILTCDWILQKMSVRNVVQIREKQVQRYNLKYFIF